MDKLPSLAETVKLFHLRADKKLGQHFLLDMNITDKIAHLTKPLDGYSVAEIGPGPGGLTRSLFKAGAQNVLALEMDERFLPALEIIKSNIGTAELNVKLGDALKVNIGQELSGSIKIAANLPYNVGTKMLLNWLTATPLFWDQAVLMFQKEVAERVVARPGEKAYGRLAIIAQSVCECHLAFEVPAKAFSPPPKVDSAVVDLKPLPADKRFADLDGLAQVTQAAFGQRRKMLRRSLKTLAAQNNMSVTEWLDPLGIDETRRPETLSVSEFQALTQAYRMPKLGSK